jgi:glutathione synthase/RimK-type ligase-like ATP-grasp enzyme
MNIKIYPYKAGSASAKALSEVVDGKVLKREGKALKADLIVNWGSSNIDRHLVSKVFLNKAESIKLASNKLSSFEAFAKHDVPTVEWTTDDQLVYKWLAEGFDVVSRKKLTGHSGEGIVINQAGTGVFEIAPLYTKYTKKKDEYRIHVFQGKVIFQQRKARKKDVPDEQVNWQVRNLAGGFIFANDNIEAPRCVCEAAVMAVQALGLDFGAADVGFNNNKASVYEVNTACGLMGKTLEAYAEAIRHVQMD